MPATVSQIRREVMRRGGWYKIVTATSGSASTLADTENLRDSGESIHAYEDKWARGKSGTAGNIGKVRRIDAYSPSSGTITFGNALGAAIVAGDVWEVFDFDPTMVDECIATALRRCTTIREDILLAATTGSTRIKVSDELTWVSQAEQILRLRHATSLLNLVAGTFNAEGVVNFSELPPYSWRAELDNGSVYIELHGGMRNLYNLAVPPYTYLMVRTIAPFNTGTYDEPGTLLDATSFNIPLDWIVPMTMVELITRVGKNTDLLNRGTFRLDLATMVLEATAATATYAPSINDEVRIYGG